MSRKNNSKGNKNSEYSINPGLIEKVKTFTQNNNNRDHPPLNKNKQSLPLELFDSYELVPSYDKP